MKTVKIMQCIQIANVETIYKICKMSDKNLSKPPLPLKINNSCGSSAVDPTHVIIKHTEL